MTGRAASPLNKIAEWIKEEQERLDKALAECLMLKEQLRQAANEDNELPPPRHVRHAR